MLRFFWLLLALVLVGCGSGGGGSGAGGSTDPAFVGRWLGTWTSTGKYGTQIGTADVTISSDGKLSGTARRSELRRSI